MCCSDGVKRRGGRALSRSVLLCRCREKLKRRGKLKRVPLAARCGGGECGHREREPLLICATSRRGGLLWLLNIG